MSAAVIGTTAPTLVAKWDKLIVPPLRRQRAGVGEDHRFCIGAIFAGQPGAVFSLDKIAVAAAARTTGSLGVRRMRRTGGEQSAAQGGRSGGPQHEAAVHLEVFCCDVAHAVARLVGISGCMLPGAHMRRPEPINSQVMEARRGSG